MPTEFIEGPAGRLEYCLDVAADSAASTTAILCHPHPLYGGSMHDGALALINQTLLELGINTLRFNFRGVGGSEGGHDHGNGEVDDICAVADWVRSSEQPGQILLCGYSFGGAMALQAQPRVQADKLILLAPAVTLVPEFEQSVVPTLVLLGDSDQFIPVDDARSSFNSDNVTLKVIQQTDHFFMGAADAVRSTIRDWPGVQG